MNINRIELLPNASKFAVFAALRAILIESESRGQSIFDILENSKKLPGHPAAIKAQEIDNDGDNVIDDSIDKPIDLPIPEVSSISNSDSM